jgi:hypothetical protein
VAGAARAVFLARYTLIFEPVKVGSIGVGRAVPGRIIDAAAEALDNFSDAPNDGE